MVMQEIDLILNDIGNSIICKNISERAIQSRIITGLRKRGIYAHSLPDSSIGTKEFDFFFYFKKRLFLVELKKGKAKLRRDQMFTIERIQHSFKDVIYVLMRVFDDRLIIE